jgi:hypothetical protein
VLLPLLPSNNPPNNYPAGRVMILGGGNKANATATTEIIDFSQHTPQWVRMGDMPSGRRVEGNSVLLPSGAFPDSLGHGGSTVFVQGGSAINENASTATLGADLFDRATNTWSSSSAKPGGAGFAKYPRLYHSVALLLPDATVLTAGSNPQRGTWSSATLLLKFMARLRLGFCHSTIRRYRLLESQLSGRNAALLNRRRIEFLSFSRKMSARPLSPTDATPSAT